MNFRKTAKWLLGTLIIILVSSCSGENRQTLTILATTDVHGVIFPYDFIEKKEIKESLAGVYSYVNKLRNDNEVIMFFDNGDNLQGQPPVYFYNFIDTVSPHLNAEVMNFMGYDAGTVGNHDIEAGHSVYDRLINEYNFPLLAANSVEKATGKPYFEPYVVIKRNGIKVAVLGLITPEVPTWLPSELYAGMEFRDMVETAKLWMPDILKEKPDLIVGLFHSGWEDDDNAGYSSGSHNEKGSGSVARNVPGFDIIICGHNHNLVNKKIINSAGDSVLILEGGSRSGYIARADVEFHGKKADMKKPVSIRGRIIEVENIEPDPGYMEHFTFQYEAVKNYVNKEIAFSGSTFSTRDAYFGSSAFVDMIHSIQLDITHADISFAAPLSFDVKIEAGPITVGDMFKLYRFENMLYTIYLSGKEIKKYLEFSYSQWLNTMKGPDDYLLKFRFSENGKPVLSNGKAWLRNQPYNFDSAAGIDYTVDVSKPEGERIKINSFSDGRQFEPDQTYRIAVNSYRGNGGGGHLTAGAGIAIDELSTRLITSTERDLRYYILSYLEKVKTIRPVAGNNWKIIPEQWVRKAAPRDFELLFGK